MPWNLAFKLINLITTEYGYFTVETGGAIIYRAVYTDRQTLVKFKVPYLQDAKGLRTQTATEY